ncbi:MAG: leucine--tRNA ligase [Candidatus Lloydbacteria bacterium CG22_combo_CG10-13_8_21_14_all_47_15]|uniref:Leucine--tRNA ligase n=1 Tax=Candidatus Lloydbacteria bacterium CG22_combo_CG10-13_8_21_14_all_47_15 TaxID=1974635 RepID=A0A2H0CTJ2_9BACT|nr:MAG: leucine--tRNA ligase [Candidatus Lloydbacteria bacterium CG22_combo_CG10-13_8_21_14_all_47_15]
MAAYDHKKIEEKWQRQWDEEGVYITTEKDTRPKRYILDMFPYPSGDGLHVGHPKGYIATDIYSRYQRMQGCNVLHPMGWDAFGLPAENYAIKNKVHPRQAVEKNIARYKSQLKKIGLDYDWEREINTTDPAYYKWTQWIFLQLFKKGLAYESSEPINWCPSCKTGLANEDVQDGRCERCDTFVEKKPLRQWVLRITQYAERLLTDIDELAEWPEHIKELQRNWIGKSDGAEISFCIAGHNEKIQIFTTRPDTLFGATYMVLAPEHPLVEKLQSDITNWNEVDAYRHEAEHKGEIERTAVGKEKTGVRLDGVMAVNPANNEDIPIFIADYVLGYYGTGAIMAVPAHDERDLQFAKKYNLPIRQVVIPNKEQFEGAWALIETPRGTFLFQKRDGNAKKDPSKIVPFGGMRDEGEDITFCLIRELKEELCAEFSKEQIRFLIASDSMNDGEDIKNNFLALFYLSDVSPTHVRLGDEGEAIMEMTLEDALAHPDVTEPTKNIIRYFLGEKTMVKAYTGEGDIINSGVFDGMTSTNAKDAITEFVGGKMMAQYKLRDWVFSRQRYWGEPIPLIHCEACGVVAVPEKDLPVTLPIVERYEPTGTGESPLADIEEWVNTTCPECCGPAKRETNTMPQWAGSSWYYLRYIDPTNSAHFVGEAKERYWMSVDMYVGGAEHATRHLIYARFWHKFLYDNGFVSTNEPFTTLKSPGLIYGADGRKMSKRWGNVVNPDDVVDTYGADTLRLYEMFMGPFADAAAWNTESIIGPRRFLERVWRLLGALGEYTDPALESLLHKTIEKVSEDIRNFRFNTAISAMMIFVNEAEKKGTVGREAYAVFVRLLAPFAPHITEEIWRGVLGNAESVHRAHWPKYDAGKIVSGAHIITVQVNGKVRDVFEIDKDISEDDARRIALAREKIKKWTDGKDIKKIVYIKNKLVNIVTG